MKENEFILQTLAGHFPHAPSELDWPKVRELARQQGLQGILYHHLKKMPTPESTLSQFKRYYQSVAVQNMITLDVLEKLEYALDSERIEVMTLKGASLLDNPYPGVGMRPMSDLDLMVRPEDYERFVDLLRRLGYEPDPVNPHYLHKGRSVIDAHVDALNTDRITNRARLFPSGMEPIWANCLPWQKGYQWVRRPDELDNILLLSQHLMKHSFSSLIWILDIYELIKKRDSAFWIRLSKRADQLSQTRPLSYALYLTTGLFGMTPPQGSRFEDQPKAFSRLERGILGARIKGQSIDRLGPLMAFFCIPGLKARTIFLWETLFPSKKIIEQEFSSAYKGKRRFFYPARLFQIALLAFRQSYLIIAALIRG